MCARLLTVFCSTDLAQEIRHPIHTNVQTPEGSQILINVFDWSSLQNDSFDSHFDLKKVVLRLYKDGNFTKECANATLQAKVYCKHAKGDSEFTGVAQYVNMSNGRYWEELDLTEQFKSIWPIPYGGWQVYVTITLKSQCENKLPIKLHDLKSITKLKLRRKLYSNQPVLCLYLNNDMIEKLARDSAGHMEPIPDDEVLSVPAGKQSKTKRGESQSCRKVSHIVNFKELGFSHVILPLKFNAGRCIGTCDHRYLVKIPKAEEYKVNNYAKLLAAQAFKKDLPEVTVCCNPGMYDPLMLLVSTQNGAVKQKLFHEMRVRDCYCR